MSISRKGPLSLYDTDHIGVHESVLPKSYVVWTYVRIEL